jgi:hypothetical protein
LASAQSIATYLTPSGKRRVFRCHTCETHFAETRATIFFDLRTAADKARMGGNGSGSISFAPEFRLMIAAIVGPRTRDTAKEVVAAT